MNAITRFLDRKKVPPQLSAQDVGLSDSVSNGWYLDETDELVEGLRITNDDHVLDVGCGDGLAVHFCARKDADVTFVDIDPAKVDWVKSLVAPIGKGRKKGIVSDSMPLPLDNESATKILAMEMLEHTEKPEEILAELVRVGKPGAQYLITVPEAESERVQRPLAPSSYFQRPNHIQVFTRDEFLQLVKGAGLEIESYRATGFFWAMWWCLFWMTQETRADGSPVADRVRDASSDVLGCWTRVWHEILHTPRAKDLMNVLNSALPKSQAVIARKPVTGSSKAWAN